MEVELISFTQNMVDLIYTACRTCYSPKTPIQILREEKDKEDKIALIKKVLDSKHESTIEHVYFSFALCGISRSLLAQLTRHRLCSFSVQSTRYVEIKENLDDLIILKTCGTDQDKMQLLSKYFVFKEYNEIIVEEYLNSLITYQKLIKGGRKPEQARMVLPNALKTNIVMSCNLRELIHICHLRLCTHAEDEIRLMVKRMKDEILNKTQEKWLAKYLVPNCINCTDFRGCDKGE